MAGQRHRDPSDLAITPGVMMNRTARNAKGRWVDGDNVRWREGLAEKFGGFVELDLTDYDDVPKFYEGRARACHEWDSLDGQNWIAFGTHCKLYLINNDHLFDITPIRKASSVVNGLSTVNGSPIVTIVDPGHDSIDGSHIHISGASAVGGITLDGPYEVEEVIDLDTFTVRASSNATSTASNGGGVVVIQYELNCGLETDGILDGYGTGDYGEEEYGTPRESSTFGGFGRVWALDNFGEDLLASPNGESLYWWDRTNGPDSRAVLVEGAPANMEFMCVGPDDGHVIAFGTNSAATGVQDRMFIRWCIRDDFTDWVATANNDVGSKRLDTGSRITCVTKTRSQFGVFTDKQLYGLVFVGGNQVYDFLPLGRTKPPASKNAAIDVDGILYWMARDNFYMFDGVVRQLDCDLEDYVFEELNRAALGNVYVRYVAEWTELRFHFTSIFAEVNDRTAIYNIAEKCWYPSSIRRECGLDSVSFYGYPVSFYDERVFLDENGTDVDDDEALIAFLETFDGELADGGLDMEVRKLIPDFKTLEGTMDVQLFGKRRPQAEMSQSRIATFDADTEEISLPFKRKRIGMHIESHEMGDHWRMDTWQTLIVPHGGR